MKVMEIEGVGQTYADTLRAAGVASTAVLLSTAGSPKGRKALAERTGIDEKRILEWVNRCDLMRVKGIGSQYSDLLETAGVDTVKELGTRRADHLVAKMAEVNTQKKLVRRVPTSGEVEAWVAEAKSLPSAVSY